MEAPNLLKGFLYPSSRVARCPRYHPCKVCKKCQVFDRHNLECVSCESRVRSEGNDTPISCDHIPEGEFIPDMQHALVKIEEHLNRPAAHPDGPKQALSVMTNANDWDAFARAKEMVSKFSQVPGVSMEKKIEKVWLNEDTYREYCDFMGRLA